LGRDGEDKNMKLSQLNNKKKSNPKTFVFDSFFLDKNKGEIRFCYKLDNKHGFTEILKLKDEIINWKKVDNEALNRTLFNLHLIIGISYWKTFCPKKIIINSGVLSKDEALYWNKAYTIGMGEFYYKNIIDFRGLVKFPYENKRSVPVRLKMKNRTLAPLGGGKDSIVTAEILKKNGYDFTLFSLGDSRIQEETAKIVGKKRMIFERVVDKKLFRLKNAFNGHIPISLIYSFSALLASVIYNYKYIVFSNEQSANFGNVKYLGKTINHQYSKSLEAETDFYNYVHNFITPDIDSFSLLRPFSELKISRLFSAHEKYFSHFSSCNQNFKLNKKTKKRWCGKCPKCAFTFSQLSAFLPKKDLIKIFGKNLYNDQTLLNLYLELLGEKNVKPFDCVGTPGEVKAAMLFAEEKNEFADNYIIKYFRDNIMPGIKNRKELAKKTLNIKGRHCIPKKFLPALSGIK